MKISYTKYRLQFSFDAGTSRGVLRHKDSYFIKVSQERSAKVYGIGEASPLKGLSIDDRVDFEEQLSAICQQLQTLANLPASEDELANLLDKVVPSDFPSIRFGLEVALLDLMHGGERQILKNAWSQEPFSPIHINGLVWMGAPDFMLEQIKSKLDAGFNCIKMKIGAIDFAQECRLLAYIREHYSADEITIRVDANGAFAPENVFSRLEALAEFQIHSIEQPIATGQYELMRKLCSQSPVPIALDEELIGIHIHGEKAQLLDQLRPPYIILKPSLLGGLGACREWIRLAEERNIGWWITSALESNIGLNAIAQFTATYQVNLPQGLGTGLLYHNNLDSPLEVSKGKLYYRPDAEWHTEVEGL